LFDNLIVNIKIIHNNIYHLLTLEA